MTGRRLSAKSNDGLCSNTECHSLPSVHIASLKDFQRFEFLIGCMHNRYGLAGAVISKDEDRCKRVSEVSYFSSSVQLQ